MDDKNIKIICVSDFHFNVETTEYLENKKNIFMNIIKSELKNYKNKIIFIVDGDIANRGKQEEYELAYKFFSSITEQFDNYDISFVFSPGNHDCNLEVLTNDEKIERDSILSKNYLVLEEFMKSKNSFDKPFEKYKEFISRFKSPKVLNSNSFFTTYYIEDESMYNIKIVSFNSALFYNIKSSNLKIIFDSEYINNNLIVNTNEININITHYPVEWFNRNRKDNYISLVNKNDFLICGHEHNFEISNVDNLSYVKLASMSNNDEAEKSGFSILDIDRSNGYCTLRKYEYNGQHYSVSLNENRTIKKKTYIKNSIIPIDKKIYNKIVNSNLLPISDSKFNTIDDAFIEPKLGKKILEDGVLTEKVIYFSEIDYKENSSIIFKGHNRYGKTFILKKLFANFFADGYIPMYIELKQNKTLENLLLTIRDCFLRIYGKDCINYFEQQKDKIVLLLDNINFVKNMKNDFFDVLKIKGYDKVVCTFNDDYLDFDDHLFDYNSIKCYEIKGIQHEQRYLLVTKWVEKVKQSNDDSLINGIVEKINECFEYGDEFTIEMAWIFLAAYKENENVSLVNGSKVIYYSYLFNKYVLSINEGININDQIFVDAYLSHFAYYQFTHSDCFKKDELDNFCLENIEISERNYYLKSELINRFCEKQKYSIFVEDEIKFYNSYALSYFCAKYYNNHAEKKNEILSLMDDLSCIEKANIILFYVSMTNDSDVKDKIISINEKLFEKFKKLNCEDDVEIFDMFIDKDSIKISDKSKDIKKNNQELYKKVDEDNRRRVRKSTLSRLEKELLTSKRVTEISKEIVSSSTQKPYPKRIIKSSYDMQLRKAESLIELFIFNIKNELFNNDNKTISDEDAIAFDQILRLVIAVLATLIIEIPEYSVSNKYHYLLNDIASENNNTVSSIVSTLIELYSIRGTKNELDYDRIVNLIERFDANKKNFCLLLIKFAIHREINYIGMNDKTRKKLLAKLNVYSNVTPPDNPRMRLEYDKEAKKRRLEDLK